MVRRQRLGLNLAFFHADLTDFTIGLKDEQSEFEGCDSSDLAWIDKIPIKALVIFNEVQFQFSTKVKIFLRALIIPHFLGKWGKAFDHFEIFRP